MAAPLSSRGPNNCGITKNSVTRNTDGHQADLPHAPVTHSQPSTSTNLALARKVFLSPVGSSVLNHQGREKVVKIDKMEEVAAAAEG